MVDKLMPKKIETKAERKARLKARPKPRNLMTYKSYWIALALIVLVFIFTFGYLNNFSLAKDALVAASLLTAIGLVFNFKFKPDINYEKRKTFMYVGASTIGLGIWVALVFFFIAIGLNSQIASSIGVTLFATTSLMICGISGALIGDLIGKNKERLSFFINNKFGKHLQWIRQKLM